MSEKTQTRYVGKNRIVDQRRLKRACAIAQTRQSLRCSHTQSIDIDEDSDQKIDL